MNRHPLLPKHSFRAGFTLVELLVIVGIIAILMSIAFPVSRSMLRRARAAECQGNLKQWGLAFSLYINDHNGLFPRDGSDPKSSGSNIADPKSSNGWFNVLPPYINVPTMAQLLKDRRIPCPGIGKSPYVCPEAPIIPALAKAYTSGGRGNQTEYYNSYAYNMGIDNSFTRASKVRNASALAIFADGPTGNWHGGEGGGSRPGYQYSKTSAVPMAESEGGDAFRHGGIAHICFFDGHVQGYRKVDIWHKGMDSLENYGGVQWNPNKDLDNKPYPTAK